MKRLFTLLFFAGIALFLQAQNYSITVAGMVTDANGSPVAGVDIFIYVPGNNPAGYFYSNQVETAADGTYSDQFNVPDNLGQGVVNVQMIDCDSSLVTQNFGFWPGGSNNFTADFDWCANGSGGNCSATIDVQYVPGSITATLTVTATGTPPFTYFWNNFSGSNSPTITVTQSGTYCAAVVDANGCSVTACATVQLGNNSGCSVEIVLDSTALGVLGLTAIPTGSAPYTFLWSTGETTQSILIDPSNAGYCVTVADADGCTATDCFSFSPCSVYITPGNASMFAVASGTAPFSYQWNTGDTSSTTQYQPNLANYCVTVTDATGCESSDCITINGGCSVTIVEVLDPATNVISLVASVPSNAFTFLWNTGETTPSISPTTAGTYCVTVEGNGCTATDCYDFDPNANASYSIQGFVNLPDSNFFVVLEGTATLYAFDPATNVPSLLAEVPLNSNPNGVINFYSFDQLPAGAYLVKISLDANSPYYEDYLPTYYGNVLYWDEATVIIVPIPFVSYYNVTLVEGQNLGGNGSGNINGTLTEGDGFTGNEGENRGEGDPVPNASILLLDETEQPVTHTLTDETGEYSFSNLPFGTYKVVVEITGKEQAFYWVTLSPGNESATVNFKVNENGVTSLADLIASGGTMNVFPNPAKGMLYIQIDSPANEIAQLTLTSPMGKTVFSKQQTIIKGDQQFEIGLGDLPTGIYFLNLTNGRDVISKKIIKE